MSETPMDRTTKALHGVDLDGRGLELGPAYNPLVPKSSGKQIDTLDHAPREELVQKYRELHLPEDVLAKIDEVDFLWDGGSLVDVVPEAGAYDYVIASHFVEHTVDLIGFLQDCQALLRSTGRVALVIPDKRVTFDFFRPLTSLGTIVDAHLNPTRFHPASAAVDHNAYVARKGADIAWTRGDQRAIELQETLTGVPELILQATAQEEYLDRHRWVFTPSWFALLINDLTELGYIDLEIAETFDTDGIEFFVTLARRSTSSGPALDRLAVLTRVDHELASTSMWADEERVAHAEAHEALRSQNDLLARQVETLRASTSWRVTRPLRAVSSRLRRHQ